MDRRSSNAEENGFAQIIRASLMKIRIQVPGHPRGRPPQTAEQAKLDEPHSRGQAFCSLRSPSGHFKEILRFVDTLWKVKKCSPVDSDYLLEIYFYWGRQLAAGAKEVMNDYKYSDSTFCGFGGASISSCMCHFGRR